MTVWPSRPNAARLSNVQKKPESRLYGSNSTTFTFLLRLVYVLVSCVHLDQNFSRSQRRGPLLSLKMDQAFRSDPICQTLLHMWKRDPNGLDT